MLNIQLRGDAALEARFRSMASGVRAEITKEVTTQTLILESLVKHKLSGDVLNVVTGNLRASINETVTSTDTQVVGKVFSAGDVKYAAIHEFGGKTPAHVIEAKGNALAFMMGGKQVFAKRVNHPGSQMPERSFLRSSLRDRHAAIVDGLQKAAQRGVRR